MPSSSQLQLLSVMNRPCHAQARGHEHDRRLDHVGRVQVRVEVRVAEDHLQERRQFVARGRVVVDHLLHRPVRRRRGDEVVPERVGQVGRMVGVAHHQLADVLPVPAAGVAEDRLRAGVVAARRRRTSGSRAGWSCRWRPCSSRSASRSGPAPPRGCRPGCTLRSSSRARSVSDSRLGSLPRQNSSITSRA